MKAIYFNVVSIQRISQHTVTDEHVSVGSSYMEPIFNIGVVNDGDSNTFKIIQNGKILHEEEELEWAVEGLMKTLVPALKLNEGEAADIAQILQIQDDADYVLDRDVWVYEVGNGGEILAEESAENVLLVNVYPFYNTTVEMDHDAGTAGDDDCVERHEFCGLRFCR